MRTVTKGIGGRLVELLKKSGYESDRSKYGVDVSRFTREHGIIITQCFKWLANEARPSDDNVLMLAEILGVSPGYILFGDDNQVRPISGGSSNVLLSVQRYYVNHIAPFCGIFYLPWRWFLADLRLTWA